MSMVLTVAMIKEVYQYMLRVFIYISYLKLVCSIILILIILYVCIQHWLFYVISNIMPTNLNEKMYTNYLHLKYFAYYAFNNRIYGLIGIISIFVVHISWYICIYFSILSYMLFTSCPDNDSWQRYTRQPPLECAITTDFSISSTEVCTVTVKPKELLQCKC